MDTSQVGVLSAPLTASGTVKTGAGRLYGFYVHSTTAGTIVLRNGTGDGDTPISGTITPAVGFHSYLIEFVVGLRATIGATIDVTFFFR